MTKSSFSSNNAARARGPGVIVREARTHELDMLGRLLVSVYSTLDGFPTQDEQPQYYAMLATIGQRSGQPDTKLLVAVADGSIVGAVVYFSDMARYGSGGSAPREKNASGFRLLAVTPEARGMGVGKALAERCIELARSRSHAQVILHTTNAMNVARSMYERLGFERSPELDFVQEKLEVFGYRLRL